MTFTREQALAAAERMVRRVEHNPETGCVIWTGARNNRGYGTISVEGRLQLTHRVSYVVEVGPIPDGLQIDHLCRVKACVNPAHLEPVTARENQNRRPDVAKAECTHGHALTADNLIVRLKRNGHVMRNCRTCNNDQQRLRRLSQSIDDARRAS